MCIEGFIYIYIYLRAYAMPPTFFFSFLRFQGRRLGCSRYLFSLIFIDCMSVFLPVCLSVCLSVRWGDWWPVTSTCNRSSFGVLGGPQGEAWGGPRARGRSQGCLGGPQGGSRGGLEAYLKMVIFSFLGGEFCIRPMKYWCFRFGVVFWIALLQRRCYCFLMTFWGMYFATSWGENIGNPCVFWYFSISHVRNFLTKWWRKIDFWEVNFEACAEQFWW